MIPLFLPNDFDVAEPRVLAVSTQAHHMRIPLKATYLGAQMGPHGHREGWDAPLAKFRARLERWSGVHLGLHQDTRIYKTFIFSILQFHLPFYPI